MSRGSRTMDVASGHNPLIHVEATCSMLELHGGVGVVDLASGIALLLELVNWKLNKQK